MRTISRLVPPVALLPVVLSLSAAVPARGEPLPLPPADQARVNQAIEHGVTFLKKSQGPKGTWADARGKHILGYAALPGLTLLECGVPANDPVIRRTAAFVRRQAPGNDATYEIALAVLFLDRLGDPKDEPLIRALAVRLLAGQDETGGWKYRCGTVSKKNQEEILALLRKMAPGKKGPGLEGLPVGKPNGPRLAGAPVQKGPALEGTPAAKPAGLPPTGPALAPPTSSGGAPAGKETTAGARGPAGTTRAGPIAPAPLDGKPAAKPDAKATPAKNDAPAKAPEGEVVIPRNLRVLAAFRDRPDGPLDGGRVRRSPVLLDRTDNSNSQFALLALWAAQRHGVPMERTLRLAARRYEKSQNGDGTWDYLFYYGGAPPKLEDPDPPGRRGALKPREVLNRQNQLSRRPQMTCVGLMGLAIGQGLRPAAGGKLPPDPQIVNGFAALSLAVGQPNGDFLPVPQQNLYYLWSLERVAVLYDLPTVGGKDWYRWGAESLVANQQPLGDWDKGGYIGSTRTIDTCLALLFLKRVNLAKDLTRKLPFDPIELSRTIKNKVGSQPAGAPVSPGGAPSPPPAKKN